MYNCTGNAKTLPQPHLRYSYDSKIHWTLEGGINETCSPHSAQWYDIWCAEIFWSVTHSGTGHLIGQGKWPISLFRSLRRFFRLCHGLLYYSSIGVHDYALSTWNSLYQIGLNRLIRQMIWFVQIGCKLTILWRYSYEKSWRLFFKHQWN